MPTKREREYYAMGFRDGMSSNRESFLGAQVKIEGDTLGSKLVRKPKRKLSDWQKFIKANSSKKKFKFANGKLKLKTMGIAYRKTAAYKRNKKK